MLHDDVAPELHGAPMLLQEIVDFQQKFKVDFADAPRFYRLLAAAFAKAPRFIAAHVELSARKIREHVAVHVLEKRDAAGIDRAKIAAVRRFRKVRILRVLEPPVHMPEGILIGHEFDKALLAVSVEGADLRRRHRRSVFPYHVVIAIGEGVLRVKLKLVAFPFRKRVHQAVQRGHFRRLIPRNIKHHAPIRKIRPILDMHFREGAPGRALTRNLH